MEERYFLLEEDFLTAEANGISRRLATQRVENYGWTVERAITEKKNKKGSEFREMWDHWKDVSESNGITKDNFRQRVQHQGLTPEVAATKKKRGNWTSEERETIQSNGLNLNIVNTRINVLGWEKERAMTESRTTYEERGKRISATLKKKYAEKPNDAKWGNRN